MDCYICGNDTKVVNSRSQSRLNQVWRRRVCVNCDYIFTTNEKINLEASMSVRLKDDSVGPFIKEKLLISVNSSLGHRKNHVIESIALTDTVLTKLQSKYKTPLLSRNNIVSTVKEVLDNFDKVASTHYDAYHQMD